MQLTIRLIYRRNASEGFLHISFQHSFIFSNLKEIHLTHHCVDMQKCSKFSFRVVLLFNGQNRFWQVFILESVFLSSFDLHSVELGDFSTSFLTEWSKCPFFESEAIASIWWQSKSAEIEKISADFLFNLEIGQRKMSNFKHWWLIMTLIDNNDLHLDHFIHSIDTLIRGYWIQLSWNSHGR